MVLLSIYIQHGDICLQSVYRRQVPVPSVAARLRDFAGG